MNNFERLKEFFSCFGTKSHRSRSKFDRVCRRNRRNLAEIFGVINIRSASYCSTASAPFSPKYCYVCFRLVSSLTILAAGVTFY